MAVVLLMIVSLPTLLVDWLLSIDIGLAVVLLLTAHLRATAVEFSIFLSLPVAQADSPVAERRVARLVLLNADDGIEAAGQPADARKPGKH
jgi:flagellar biosynthesis protein FlhA